LPAEVRRKLYIAEPDAVKAASFGRQGIGQVGKSSSRRFRCRTAAASPRSCARAGPRRRQAPGLILDHDLTPERFFYVMRYVPGESLSLTTKKLTR